MLVAEKLDIIQDKGGCLIVVKSHLRKKADRNEIVTLLTSFKRDLHCNMTFKPLLLRLIEYSHVTYMMCEKLLSKNIVSLLHIFIESAYVAKRFTKVPRFLFIYQRIIDTFEI